MRLLIVLLLMTGCATPLTKEARSVRILLKSDAPARCKEVGELHTHGLFALSESSIHNDLRQKAYNIGADTVTYRRDTVNPNFISGTGFKCN